MIDIARETLVSPAEVAEKLRVTVKTVTNWMNRESNPLESTKYGGKVVTSLEALQRFGQPRGEQKKPKRKVGGGRLHEAAMKSLKENHGL